MWAMTYLLSIIAVAVVLDFLADFLPAPKEDKDIISPFRF